MGRYYTGDIEGKFLFAMQPSDAADRFGVSGNQANLFYCFGEENLTEVEEELRNIAKSLGDKFSIVLRLLNHGFCDDDLKRLGVSEDDIREIADFDLGLKIRRCIKLNGYCQFEAEL
jgi:hypothetical protein